MLVAGFPAGPWAANCFVVAPAAGGDCVIIDPGMDAVSGIEEILTEHGLTPVAVALTHGHLDHIWSAQQVCRDAGIPAYIHSADRHLLSNPIAGISGEARMFFEQVTGGKASFSEPDDVRPLSDKSTIEVGDLTITALHTPGHTPGSVVFAVPATDENPPVAFTGDLLFAGSIGRTDLPGGDTDQMMETLARVVLSMDDATVVLSGHGEATQIGRERATNPYLREAAAASAAAGRPTEGT